MSNAYAATFGTALVYGTAGGTPATALANVKAINGLPTLTVDEFETSRIDQASRAKEFAPSMMDSGQLQLKLGFKKADIATLYTLVTILKSWKITFSDGSTLQWDGWLKVIGYTANVGGEIEVDVTIRVTGIPTFTAAP